MKILFVLPSAHKTGSLLQSLDCGNLNCSHLPFTRGAYEIRRADGFPLKNRFPLLLDAGRAKSVCRFVCIGKHVGKDFSGDLLQFIPLHFCVPIISRFKLLFHLPLLLQQIIVTLSGIGQLVLNLQDASISFANRYVDRVLRFEAQDALNGVDCMFGCCNRGDDFIHSYPDITQ
jgi:hypothetical protein